MSIGDRLHDLNLQQRGTYQEMSRRQGSTISRIRRHWNQRSRVQARFHSTKQRWQHFKIKDSSPTGSQQLILCLLHSRLQNCPEMRGIGWNEMPPDELAGNIFLDRG
ncbi:hypothetical protein AVEN_125749-1 [Araneus ventricosus]|uniref:Uncharacterized protein n=1 Tax=Araneus ventricosus TaxID=182803 RepID=A0A4Y2TQD1_ARAVE|nr:hypothetical protein AVEN_125749-1 [Araneus ventricosus]